MPFIQKVRFRIDPKKSNRSDNIRHEEYICFKSTESNLPKFIPRDDREALSRAQTGQYLETVDGYICPVVLSRALTFRLCVGWYGQINRKFVKEGKQLIYFKPPKGYIRKITVQISNEREKNLTPKELMFAWVFALTWNPEKALKDAGYNPNEHTSDFCSALFKRKRVRKAIMSAFRKQIKLAGLKENTFALDRIMHLYKQVEDLSNHLVDCIKNKKDIKEEDVRPLQNLLSMHRDTVFKVADWLGYNNDAASEEFRMQISGKRRGFNHILPENVPQEIKSIDYDDQQQNLTEDKPAMAVGAEVNTKKNATLSFENVLHDEEIEEVLKEEKKLNASKT